MTARVAVCIPYYRSVEPAMMMSFGELCARSAMAGLEFLPIGTRGCYIEDNRNGCVEYAINMGVDWDWLLWIDTDMRFPGDALLRLLAHDKDIVGANYRQRTPPYAYTGVYADGRDDHILEPGLHRMAQMPTGLLLTRFDIYRKMGYPWFRPGLRHEARDDIYFCRQAAALGYEIWCDHDLTKEVVHIDVQEIPWFDKDNVIVAEGAQIDNVKAAAEGRKRAEMSKEAFETAGRSAA